MAQARSSVRIRANQHRRLRLLAAQLSELRDMPVSLGSLLEEGIEGLFGVPMAEWVEWAKDGRASVSVGEESISFRIDSSLSKKVGVLAASISQQSKVPITKTHLIEEAGRRIIGQVEQEIADLQAVLSPEEVNR
jgi:hypothetical protein